MKPLKASLFTAVIGFVCNITSAHASFLTCKPYNGGRVNSVIIETGEFRCEDDRDNVYFASIAGITAGIRYAKSTFTLHCPFVEDYSGFAAVHPYFAVDVGVGFGFGLMVGTDLCSVLEGDTWFSFGASVGVPFFYVTGSEEEFNAYQESQRRGSLPSVAQLFLPAKNKTGETIGLFTLKGDEQNPQLPYWQASFSNHEGIQFWGTNVRWFNSRFMASLFPPLKENMEPINSSKFCSGGGKCLVMDKAAPGATFVKWRMISDASTWNPKVTEEGIASIPATTASAGNIAPAKSSRDSLDAVPAD